MDKVSGQGFGDGMTKKENKVPWAGRILNVDMLGTWISHSGKSLYVARESKEGIR